MEFQGILNNISRHITLSSDEVELFTSMLNKKSLSRKLLLLRQDQLCRSIYFVDKGALRTYHCDKSGRESTVMFAVNDWWVTDMPCFISGQPSMVFIEAIEDSEIFELSKANFDLLFEKIPLFERFFRILMQNAYIREQLRIIQNLSLTAEERYDKFMDKYPQISKLVTQKQIASYLGITPEFLSAIRKNKSVAKRNQ